MQKFITPSYIFTPGISGTGSIELVGIANFNIKKLVSLFNQTRGVLIWKLGDENLIHTSISGSTITLNLDTSDMKSDDSIQILYEINEIYYTQDVDTVGSTTYIGKSNELSYEITKLVEDISGDITLRYAALKDNPTITTYGDAWDNRLTLTYTLR